MKRSKRPAPSSPTLKRAGSRTTVNEQTRQVNSMLTYAAIHVAYHVGQIYTVRHLLGETTPDN